MALAFEYLVLKNPSDQQVIDVGLLGWELVLVKATDFWFKRSTIV